MARATPAVLVGRLEELAVLNWALERSAAGESQVVVLVGEAGVGKTRCLSALVDAARARGATVLVGRCPPLSVGELPYAPIADALRTLARTTPQNRWREWFAEEHPYIDRLVPELGGIAAPLVSPTTSDSTARLFVEVRRLLERMGEDAPTVVAVDDMHWSDRSTRDLLGLIVRASVDMRLLTVLTCRSDELAPDDPLLGWLPELDRASPVERVALRRLDWVATTMLLTEVLGQPPPLNLAEQIFDRSDGNPFFAEELLAAYRSGSGDLPSTTRDSALVRFGTLPEKVQTLVCAAAIVGSASATIDHELLGTLLGLPEEEVAALIRVAVGAHVLVPVGGEAYAFRHALMREAVEADLLPMERRRWHGAVAATMQSDVTGSTDPGLLARLAHHWYAANDPKCALPAAVDAGLAAQSAHAYPEAASLYERAIALWPTVPGAADTTRIDEVELLGRASEVVRLAHSSPRAVDLATMALTLVDPATEPDRAAWLHVMRGKADWAVSGDGAVAVSECEAALDLVRRPGPGRAQALAEYALQLMYNDRISEMGAVAREATEVGRIAGDVAAEGIGLVNLAVFRFCHGEYDAALAQLGNALELARSRDQPWVISHALIQRANIHEAGGSLKEAAEDHMTVAREAARSGMGHTLGVVATAFAAIVMVELGRWAEADIRTSGPMVEPPSLRMWQLMARVSLLTARGDLAEAQVLADDLAPLVAPVRDSQVVECAYPLAAELAIWTNRPEAARRAVAEGLDRIDSNGSELANARLCWLGLRVEADLDAGRRSVDPALIARLRTELAEVMSGFLSGGAGLPTHMPNRALAHLAEAELSRLIGSPTAAPWEAAARIYDAIGARYRALYPRWRAGQAYLAQGDRTSAATALRHAYQAACDLGALPIRDAISGTARRARIVLAERPTSRQLPPYGLTAREVDVLTLVARGATNREIAQALWISERTVDAHVSRMLTKVGATRRTEAAMIAVRIGLVEAS